jgi:hypothetical protein
VAITLNDVVNEASVAGDVTADGLSATADMALSDSDQLRRFDGTKWVRVDAGETLPTRDLYQYDEASETWEKVPSGTSLPADADADAGDVFWLTAPPPACTSATPATPIGTSRPQSTRRRSSPTSPTTTTCSSRSRWMTRSSS